MKGSRPFMCPTNCGTIRYYRVIDAAVLVEVCGGCGDPAYTLDMPPGVAK